MHDWKGPEASCPLSAHWPKHAGGPASRLFLLRGVSCFAASRRGFLHLGSAVVMVERGGRSVTSAAAVQTDPATVGGGMQSAASRRGLWIRPDMSMCVWRYVRGGRSRARSSEPAASCNCFESAVSCNSCERSPALARRHGDSDDALGLGGPCDGVVARLVVPAMAPRAAT